MDGKNVVAEIKSFKDNGGGEEYYDAADTLEIVDVNGDEIEVALDLPKERVYLKFRLSDLIREAMQKQD